MAQLIFREDLVRPPGRPADLGIPIGLVEDLFMRRVLLERQSPIQDVATALGLTMPAANDVASALRNKKALEYQGMEGRDYNVGLTELGQKLTSERMANGSYADFLPVALEDYVSVVNAQKADAVLNRETIRAAFGDLVVAEELLDQLGPAFLSDGAIFLYGPPGTGKTSLAERMIRLHHDKVFVPRAVEVDGSIITVYDPATHKAVEPQPAGIDARWVLCDRPIVIVGGELSPSMLDLEHDQVSGAYTAPIQMQANNGILVVDDLGRQTVRPDDLLNRWIVPLARGIDYLRLSNGGKFTVPFELKLVTSTNLDPKELGDDAFLRRLRNKVYVGPITDTAFNWILVRVAQAKQIEVTAEAAQHLRRVCEHFLGELRPYVAVDFCELMTGVCAYEGIPQVLDIPMIDRVAQVYFVTDGSNSAGTPIGATQAPTPPRSASQPQPAPQSQVVRQPQQVPPPQSPSGIQAPAALQ